MTVVPSSILLIAVAKVDSFPLYVLHSSQWIQVVLGQPLLASFAILLAIPGHFSQQHRPLSLWYMDWCFLHGFTFCWFLNLYGLELTSSTGGALALVLVLLPLRPTFLAPRLWIEKTIPNPAQQRMRSDWSVLERNKPTKLTPRLLKTACHFVTHNLLILDTSH